MSKMYPNGGYRNKDALELSMPKQAAPPIVSGSPVRESQNNASRASIDLRDQVRQDRASVRSGDSIELKVDLRGFADKHASELSNNQRDHMNRGSYGSGKQGVTIDLKGGEYRVNGKGALARAALKLARDMVRGGKRLPKNLYKELILAIVDQLLSQLSGIVDKMWPEPTTILTVPGNLDDGVWSYDPRFAQYKGGNSIEVAAANGVTTAYPDIDDYPLSLGEYAAASVSALPSGSTSAINTWLANGKTPYTTSRDEIFSDLKDLINHSTSLGYAFRNIVRGGPNIDATFNSQLIVTFRLRRGEANQVIQQPGLRLKVNPHLYPYGDSSGGEGDPFKPVKTDWRHTVPDKKYGMPGWLHGITAAAFGATEFGDLIDSFYDALPKNRQYGRSYLDKLKRLHDYWHEIDFGKALTNVVYNHFEDKVVGKINNKISHQLRSTDIGGTNYKYGVAGGTGSTIYTGSISF